MANTSQKYTRLHPFHADRSTNAVSDRDPTDSVLAVLAHLFVPQNGLG